MDIKDFQERVKTMTDFEIELEIITLTDTAILARMELANIKLEIDKRNE